MSVEGENDNFALSSNQSLNRPLLASVVGIEIVAALFTNLFVLIYTLCHPKILRQSSIIFLTNFVLANLFMVVFYMSTIVITAIFGEWVFGATTEQKAVSCRFVGYVFNHNLFLTTFTLTAISVDRFIFIVKPLVHRRFVKTWVAVLLTVILWIVSTFISVLPLFGFGRYVFSVSNATCVPAWIDHIGYTALGFLVIMACLLTIAITTIWTFCFTRRVLKNFEDMTREDSEQKHVYNSRIIKVIGIFSMMLLVTAITYSPGVLAFAVGIIIGFENLPDSVYTAITVLFYTITISNPIIQAYFRKDLNVFICKVCKKVFRRCNLPSHQSVSDGVSSDAM